MKKTVDSYRFLDAVTTRMVKAWIKREPDREIPWTAPARPLEEARVALISSAAIAPLDSPPFDQQGERENPWWGDPSFRSIPASATSRTVGVHHLHIDTAPAEEDLGCVLPLEPLARLAADGEIGSVAPTHYSFMGYLMEPRQFLAESVPEIILGLRREEVDLVLLAPV